MQRTATLTSFLVLFATAAIAQDWTGALNSDWNNPGNWSDQPQDGENVTIDPANYTGAMADPVIGAASAFTPDRLYVNGGTLTIAAGLTVTDRFIVTGPGAVEMSAGVLSSGRLVMDLGGTFHFSTGAISIASVLALADGAAGTDSRFEQTGGTVTVSGELAFECETGAFDPAYQQTGGTLVVNGDMVWFGAAPGSGRPRFVSSSGATAINGSVLNTVGSTVDLYVELNGGALTTNGASIDLAHATDSILMTSGSWQVDGDVVIENDGVVHITGGPVVFEQAAELRGSGSYQFHDVQIYTGSSLQHTDPQEISVSGDWLNQSSFDPDVNTVVFNGTTSQLITAGDFHGLRMNNNGAGVLLAGECTVAGPLTLENGLIRSLTNDMLTLTSTATATSGSPNSHVNGPMKKIGENTFVFPIGKNGSWRRIGVDNINAPDAGFTAEYFDEPHSNTTSFASGLDAVSTVEHWSLTQAGTLADAQVQLYWEDASASGINDCSTLVVAHWDGAFWQGSVSTTSGSCAGNDAGTVRSVPGISDFGIFTFGVSDGTIGITESMAGPLLQAHPVPASERVSFMGLPLRAVIRVVDETGRTIQAFLNENSFDVSDWPNGLYTLLSEDRAVRFIVAH